ncbi:MAG: ABC transporter ATP-binding protein, partial [Candidatus Promineifilaceae bacterium]
MRFVQFEGAVVYNGCAMTIFRIRNLTKQYARSGYYANRNITLDIAQGEIFGLLGANGAGKSTLVKQMVNLLSPSEGEIVFMDGRVNSAEMLLYIGYMPQKAQALNTLTIDEALYFTAHLRGMSVNDAKNERDRLVALWQLDAFRQQNSQSLSGGQRRLMRLAVAMAGDPLVLILDEPTNDLDPERRKLVWDILRDVNQTKNTTVIFITHDALEAEKII